MKIQVDAPINNLSFGNVSFNILRELVKREKVLAFFPQSNQADFSAFDKVSDELKGKIAALAQRRHSRLDSGSPVLKIWHLNGSEFKVADKQYLYTAYETDEPTMEEINLAANQEAVIFTSSHAADIFKERGLDNVHHVPLGFDPDFCVDKDIRKLDEDVIHFGLIGKLEKRKNTQRIIQLWLSKYGNNPKYQLTCLVNNPFFEEKIFKQIIAQTLGGKHWSNINFLPHLKTNSEVNSLHNAIDIDLSGLSAAEGTNLPAFNSTALGKWSTVTNCTGHKDWANESNCILVETDGKEPCYDNAFFKQGAPFNQGNFYKVTDEAIIDAMERAEKLAKTENKEGLKLQSEFSYQKTVDKLLEII